ncbi:MAG: dTDP-4-dehydrorhamnose reductase [Bacteroidetes bacterium]|nr:dTDP-4-dehydrorhamnose reductase [Bacteroidota bacterium]
MKILVTGSNGQLGLCLQNIAQQYSEHDFVFLDSTSLDITNRSQIEDTFEEYKPQICINAAAYTAVDKAETEFEKAFAVNAYGVENLASLCEEYKALLIHISTDYVFDGTTELPYSEDDFTSPLGVYGASKLLGEELAMENNPKTIIIRTSWLYSEHQKNFVKTMLHLFNQKKELGIVNDQFGQPTNANDLATAIMEIISRERQKMGIYHFSNYPETTWYHFAQKIAEFSHAEVQLNPITTAEYPTPAQRPMRSTFCLDKIETDYGIEAQYWENSLEDCIAILTQK